ncbi:unnamed protein product [Mytilus coruscus]|uniref:Uncharacterized protein n=1 Tax=Mytilus coruscus TaxID=42192 RepID=A0A6J8BVZ6_MYTCO|nr:unnamed protein product [Mytilus coruscus]
MLVNENGKMRLNTQLIRSRAKGPLQTVEYLDLSNTGIETIEKLNSCAKLHTLNLRGNALYEVINLESCQQLWNIDLSNNELKSLDGLSKFVALGNLNLSNNDLTWHELGKIRHLHILNLSFHGNRQLEKDPYYRIHIVDCLPHVWMLDGRLITAGERLQVKNFFHESALTEHPIRHKLSKDWFIPTAMKRIDVTGIFGDKATHVMTKFPVNGMYNVETDRRRLKYIAYSLQEDLLIEKKYTQNDYQILRYHKSFMEDILSSRPRDRERCNMLLMLLVASLEFVMPTHLMKDTLETTKLSKVGNVFTMDIFLLSRDVRCYIVSILLGAVKVDKDDKEDGGLYDKLYLCLFYTISELTKLSHAVDKRECAIRSKLNTVYRDYKCLLASEVVQLLCIVPTFFDYITKDIGVMNLVITATGDKDVTEKINKVSVAVREEGVSQGKDKINKVSVSVREEGVSQEKDKINKVSVSVREEGVSKGKDKINKASVAVREEGGGGGVKERQNKQNIGVSQEKDKLNKVSVAVREEGVSKGKDKINKVSVSVREEGVSQGKDKINKVSVAVREEGVSKGKDRINKVSVAVREEGVSKGKDRINKVSVAVREEGVSKGKDKINKVSVAVREEGVSKGKDRINKASVAVREEGGESQGKEKINKVSVAVREQGVSQEKDKINKVSVSVREEGVSQEKDKLNKVSVAVREEGVSKGKDKINKVSVAVREEGVSQGKDKISKVSVSVREEGVSKGKDKINKVSVAVREEGVSQGKDKINKVSVSVREEGVSQGKDKINKASVSVREEEVSQEKEKINKVSVAVREEGGDVNKMYEELSALLLQKVQEQSKNISNKSPSLSSSDEILSPTKLSPVKSINPVDVADFHMRGVTSPEKDPPRVVSARKPAERFPKLGDSLLLGPQTLGKIVSLPQPFVALVAMDSVPAANGAMQSKLKSSEDHYTYVNMDQLLWDQNMHFWKPKGAIGDRLTIHTVEDLQKELERKANMADRQLRPNSPDWQASHGTEPLIYSPRHPPPSSAPPRPKSNQGIPRPMSSLLKEKLDLKLDLSRRTESAAGYLEARQSSENIAKPSSPTSISGETDGPSECYHCVLEAARTNEEKEVRYIL